MKQRVTLNKNYLLQCIITFKTPLNGILGYSEVIMTEMLGPIGKSTYKEYASDIHGAGQELLELINNLIRT